MWPLSYEVIVVELTIKTLNDRALLMNGANIDNDVVTALNCLTAWYMWSDWTCRAHKIPIEWLMVLKMEATSHCCTNVMLFLNTCAEPDVSVFRAPVMPTVSMRFWRYAHYFIFFKHPPYIMSIKRKPRLSWVNERAFHIHISFNSCTNFLLCVCVCVLFLSGNDSVVAPSADGHSHTLQNRALQVSIPYQGQHCISDSVSRLLIQTIVCH